MQHQRTQFSNFILATAFLFGLIVRLAAPLTARGPVNDGGLFLQMSRDLQENHFLLPAFTTYNHAGIPFAYPPLGFYLVAGLQSLTRIPLITLFAYLPALLSSFAILALYFLALQITGDKMKASLAALFYALVPMSFDWMIMGGGVTRAPALIFSFLTLAFAYRLFTTKQSPYIVLTSIFAALVVLTHPEIALQTAFIVFILALFFLRSRRSILQTMAVAALTIVLISPWWLTVLNRHGLAPFQAALGAHPRDYAASLMYLFQFNLSGEVVLAVIAVLGLIGFLLDLRERNFFLPVWIGFSYLTDPRAAPFASLIPLVLLAVKGFNSVLTGLGLTSQIENGFGSKTALNILLGLVAYSFMSGMIASLWIGNELRLLPGESQAMNWIVQNTPSDSLFLILTGDAALSDPLSEWFPALTGRRSIMTVQGHEWTPNSPLRQNLYTYTRAQSCLLGDLQCLSNWDFDYLYIRKVKPQKDGNTTQHFSLLETSLRSSQEYVIAYESSTAVIFAISPQESQ
jgi:hypothetical protein